MRRLQLNSWEFASAPRGRDGDHRVGRLGWPPANLIKKVQTRNFLNFLLASAVSGDRGVYLFARQMILRLKAGAFRVHLPFSRLPCTLARCRLLGSRDFRKLVTEI